jgi:hypothetical protein
VLLTPAIPLATLKISLWFQALKLALALAFTSFGFCDVRFGFVEQTKCYVPSAHLSSVPTPWAPRVATRPLGAPVPDQQEMAQLATAPCHLGTCAAEQNSALSPALAVPTIPLASHSWYVHLSVPALGTLHFTPATASHSQVRCPSLSWLCHKVIIN